MSGVHVMLIFWTSDPATTELYTLSLHDALPISLRSHLGALARELAVTGHVRFRGRQRDRKSTRLNCSHVKISYAVFCLKKKKRWSVHPLWLARAGSIPTTTFCLVAPHPTWPVVV